MFEADSLRQALATLGVLLTDRRLAFEIVVVGGGGLLHLAGRFDQICFKLYAAADSGPESKHVEDLLDLDPSTDEMRDAAAWVTQQDAATEFESFVSSVIAHVEASRAKG